MKKLYLLPLFLIIYSTLLSQSFKVNRLSGTNISLPLVSDFDGDQKPDVVGVARFFSPTGDLKLHLNKSEPDSLIFETIDLGIEVIGNPGFGDFDNDGDMDIVVFESVDQKVLILINDGLGSFGSIVEDAPIAYNFETADLDGDNDVDIVCVNADDETVFLMVNDGSGDFEVVNLPFNFEDVEDVKLGDPDADGDIDIVIAYESFFDSRIDLLINNGNAEFTAKIIGNDVIGGLENIQIIDINKDGREDVAYSSNGSSILYLLSNNGGNNFSKEDITQAEGSIRSFTIADFNTDGIYDVIIGCNSAANTLHKGLSRTSFDYDIEMISNIQPMFYIATGDFDSDLDLDVIVTNSDFWYYTNVLEQSFVNTFDQEIEHAKIYPNPFVDFINVELSANDMQLVVTDLLGSIVYRSNYESQNIDLHSLEQGCYFISIIDNNSGKIIQTSKIIKVE